MYMDSDSVPIYAYIENNYEKIKRLLVYEWHKKYTNDFDEDLFHSTLMNSLKTLSGCNLTEKEMKNYIVAAFKANSIRETLYHRNSTKVDTEVNYVGEMIETDDLDYDRIMHSVDMEFGEELGQAFRLWTEGYTIKDLEEKTGKSQLTYQIKKIREWILETYSEFKL